MPLFGLYSQPGSADLNNRFCQPAQGNGAAAYALGDGDAAVLYVPLYLSTD